MKTLAALLTYHTRGAVVIVSPPEAELGTGGRKPGSRAHLKRRSSLVPAGAHPALARA